MSGPAIGSKYGRLAEKLGLLAAYDQAKGKEGG